MRCEGGIAPGFSRSPRPALTLVQQGQVIEAERRVGMLWAKRFLPDSERFLVEKHGFGIVPDLLAKDRKVTQGVGRLGSSGPQARFAISTAFSATVTAS